MLGFDALGMNAIGVSSTSSQASTSNATANGASLLGLGSIAAGSASGNASSVAPGSTLIGSGSLAAGGASGAQVFDGSATGAALTGTGSIAGGSASSIVPPLAINPAMFYARPGIGWNFPGMIAGDIDTLSFSFNSVLPLGVTILSATPHIVVHLGIDPEPESIVVAGPTVNGSIVSMQVQPTLGGVAYWPRVTASLSDGEKVTLPIPGEGSLNVDL